MTILSKIRKMFRREYRIVKRFVQGKPYAVEYKSWWSPYWVDGGFGNHHATVEHAEHYAKCHAGWVVQTVRIDDSHAARMLWAKTHGATLVIDDDGKVDLSDDDETLFRVTRK